MIFTQTKQNTSVWYFKTAALMLTAALVSACAAGGSGSNAVVDRSKARWEAVVAGDYETAYAYLSPGYRSSMSRGDWEFKMRTRRIEYKGAQYVTHHCEENRCTVTFQVRYGVTRPLPSVGEWENKRLMVENWVRTEGNWWYLPEDG